MILKQYQNPYAHSKVPLHPLGVVTCTPSQNIAIPRKIQGVGIEPTTSAVWRPRHNQLDHPCVKETGTTPNIINIPNDRLFELKVIKLWGCNLINANLITTTLFLTCYQSCILVSLLCTYSVALEPCIIPQLDHYCPHINMLGNNAMLLQLNGAQGALGHMISWQQDPVQ